jgi:hypothetical protein
MSARNACQVGPHANGPLLASIALLLANVEYVSATELVIRPRLTPLAKLK